MTYSKTITWLLLIGIIVFVLFAPKYCSTAKTKTDTFETIIHDTSWSIKKEKSVVYTPGEIQYLPGDIIYIPVDTNAILADYYAKQMLFFRNNITEYSLLNDKFTNITDQW